MDARTSIKDSLPTRRAVAAPERVRPAIADRCDGAEIFKKTSYIADLKPWGRDVAKDMRDVGSIPFSMKTLLGDVGILNVKLTDARPAEAKTKWQPRVTNHTSGAPGDAHEKQCYAGI